MFITKSPLLDVLSLITTCIIIGYVYISWSYQYWKKRNVPYLEPKIPFGNFENPWKSTQPRGEHIAELYNKAKAKGWKHCGIYSMTTPVYLVVDMELVKHILTKDFNHFMDRGVYTNEKDDPIGCNLFTLAGTRWKNLRAKLTPSFSSGKLKAMFQTLIDCGLTFENHIEKHIMNKNDPIDIKGVVGCFTADVIGSCAFGIECNSFADPNSPFVEFGKKAFMETKLESLKELFVMNFPNLARSLRIRRIASDISDFYTKVVKDTIAYRQQNNIKRNDFMQLLINAKNDKNEHNGDGNSLTMDEIIAQSFVFFVAGYETSATTMTFALFELATRPEIQDRVRKEIKVVLRRHNDQITYDSLSELTYLTQVINETLRVYSPARFLQRQCLKNYKVPGEDVVVEKGTSVIISIKGIHYDKDYYKNPTVFDPERFNEENNKNMNSYVHLPFGQGPRACIAARFGIMQVKVGLTCLLRKCKVSLNEKTKLPLKMSPNSQVSAAEGGIWLNLEDI